MEIAPANPATLSRLAKTIVIYLLQVQLQIEESKLIRDSFIIDGLKKELRLLINSLRPKIN